MTPDATILDLSLRRRSCRVCALNESCLPAGLDEARLQLLDASVHDKRALERGDVLYRDGDPFRALYVVRSGALKTFSLDAAGNLQVLGFHLPGDIVGFDALAEERHVGQAEALERSNLCELPWARLVELGRDSPTLHRQLLRAAGQSLNTQHRHVIAMGRGQAQERLAILLRNLARRYRGLARDENTLNLPMSRSDIANYLGIVVETVSRLFSRMEERGVLAVNRKTVHILRPDLLDALADGETRPRADNA